MRQGVLDLPGQNVPINNSLSSLPIPQTDPMLSPNNLVSSASTYSSQGQNRGMIPEPYYGYDYGVGDLGIYPSAWTLNTTSSLNPSTKNSPLYPLPAFGSGKMPYSSSSAHGAGKDGPDRQPNTGYSATFAYDEIASAPHDYSLRYPSPYSAVSPGPSRPRPLRHLSSGISGQPGLLGVHRARRPHPYRDDNIANRPEGQMRDIEPQLSTFHVTTVGLPFSVNAGGSNSVVSTSPLDIDQVNAQTPDASLDDLNMSL